MPAETAHPMETPDEEHSIDIDAPPEAVWAVVSEVTRTPEWSQVVRRAAWLDGAGPGPSVGARFRGDNRFNGFRWSRECEVTACQPPRVFAFSTFGKDGREQTRWRYTLDPIGAADADPEPARTRVTLAYQVVSLPRWVALSRRVPGAAQTSARQATQNMTSSLQRIAELSKSQALH